MTNYNKVIEAIINGAVKATEYRDTNLIVRAVRKLFSKKIVKNHNIEIILTIGKPNYAEREFIKACIKAGEPFPVKKIQVKNYNPKPFNLKKK